MQGRKTNGPISTTSHLINIDSTIYAFWAIYICHGYNKCAPLGGTVFILLLFFGGRVAHALQEIYKNKYLEH